MNAPSPAWIADARERFRACVAAFGPAPPLVVGHHDADGLSSAALLARALARAGRTPELRVLGRGENAWSEAFAAELREREMGGLVIADLGVSGGTLRPGTPTIVVDHHVPTGEPEGATVISGHGLDPIPTTSLLAYRLAGALGDAGDLLWLAALGLIGDLGDKAPFPELGEAKTRYGAGVLREATSLVNAPRRASGGDAGPALALLMAAQGPGDVISGRLPQTAVLQAAREEVKAALDVARRLPPRFGSRYGSKVALIRLDTPCQVHPLVAQSWIGRLRGAIVLAANTGYRPGFVHFAARGPSGADLIAFLRDHAPPGAGEDYGRGHRGASGGALSPAAWNAFAAGLGFGPEARVPT